jgi:hypothetical protein
MPEQNVTDSDFMPPITKLILKKGHFVVNFHKVIPLVFWMPSLCKRSTNWWTNGTVYC